jgi:hypothetical protein
MLLAPAASFIGGDALGHECHGNRRGCGAKLARADFKAEEDRASLPHLERRRNP